MSEINNSEATIPVSESQPESLPNTPHLSESTERDSSPSQPIPTSQPTPSPELIYPARYVDVLCR